MVCEYRTPFFYFFNKTICVLEDYMYLCDMEKVLKLYKYIDGINDTPFPNEDEQVIVSAYRYDVKRMGGAPTISLTAYHSICLDKLWSYNVYAEFNGEKFFIKRIPSSSYGHTDARYKHEVELVSERIILDNVYVYDVVDASFDDDKPVSNSSKFSFFGTINEFAERLNQSLAYSGLDYRVVVDNGITSEGKLVSFDDKFFSEALQEVFNTFEIPYYFLGKVIHIGYTDNAITHTFKYGADESLLSIQKNNANYKIVNRVTGLGSSENIPYYYPNLSEKGETEALYNGERGIVQIVDTKKYDELFLSDKLIYTSIGSVITTPFTKYDYKNIKGGAEQFGANISITAEYFFTIDEPSFYDINFSLINDDYTWDSIKVIGIDVDYECRVAVNQSWTKIEAGTYKVVIQCGGRFTGDEVDDSVAGWEDAFVGKHFNLEFLIKSEERIGWKLNDKVVKLSDVGLSSTNTPAIEDIITFKQTKYIAPQPNLMPPIYRESLGKERFYNALNNSYTNEDGEFYQFENPYFQGSPKEHIVTFDHIKPTITEIKNAIGQRIDMFSEFAYDANDNDEMDDEGNYVHPYFFGKLRKFDGEFGFNLFEHAIENGEMTISMTSGSCGACNFTIAVNENQQNTVQVDNNGRLMRDGLGNVIYQNVTPQQQQNDTSKNEVWVALKKDAETFGVVMPNATNRYRPNVGDTFVILHINLPQAYIVNAENKLKDEIVKYMWLNNSEKFNFSISFSRIFFAEHPEILAQLNENARIQIEYDNKPYELYISSYSYTMGDGQLLPEIKVELSDTLTITQNAIQQAISEVKEDILSTSASIDVLKLGLRYFLRKDVDDRSKGVIATDKAFEVGKFKQGTLGSGASIYQDEKGNTYGELDFLTIRKKAMFSSITIQEAKHIGGEVILSTAAMVCTNVEELSNGYKCYMQTKDSNGTTLFNEFEVGDQARCQTFNLDVNRYYWRLVIEVGYNYIVLSKTDCDTNSDVPQANDNIVLLGNRNNESRQSAIILSAYSDDAPSYKQYRGINGYTLVDKEVTILSPNGNKLTGIVTIEAGSSGWENLTGLPESVKEAIDASVEAKEFVESQEYGKNNLIRNSGFTGDYVTAVLDGGDVLKDGSEMFSPSFTYWTADGASVMDSDESESGKEVMLISGGSLKQRLYFKMIVGESYVFSFKGRGIGSVTFSVGGHTKNFAFNSEEFETYVEKFVAREAKDLLVLEAYQDCFLCELQLERGTLKSAWGVSPLDNHSELAKYESLKYMSDAIEKGSSEDLGGLRLANMMLMKNLENKITAGTSGLWMDDNSVAYFAGGDYEQAIRTAMAYMDDPTYQPSTDELNNMAKFVVTHGGRAILNDVILRGYIYALGGKFKGTVEATDGKFRGEIEALSGTFQNIKSPNGRFEIDDSGNVQIGAFFTRTNSLTNQDSNGNYVGGATISSRAYDVSNGKDRIAEIGSDIVLGANGVYCMGRFENGDDGGYYGTNYGIMVGAYNAGYNAAIAMEGGYIQGFALKTIVLDSYTTTHTLNRKDTIVICNNSNELILTLPSMRICDDGHAIKIKRMNANVVLKAEKCETMKSDGSSRGFEDPVLVENPTTTRVLAERGFSFATEAGGYIDLVWAREAQYVVNGKTYYGAWIVINR